MSGSGPWLAKARFDGGLSIPRRRHRAAADLRLTADHAVVTHGSTAVALDWDACGWRASSAEESRWAITLWWADRGGRIIGIALRTSGACRDDAAVVSRSTRTPLNALGRLAKDRGVVALYPAQFVNRSVEADLKVVGALTEFLSRFPESRRRLDERSAVDRLLADIRAKRLIPPPYGMRGSRSSVEIFSAIRQSRYVHEFRGRPLPGEDLGDVDAAVDLITRSLRSSPYNEGRAVSERQVREILEKQYFDVDPWPFAALM